MGHPSFLDQICIQAEQGLRALSGIPFRSGRPSPGLAHPQAPLLPSQRKHLAGLMRVNHAGEICAQALYHGQAMVASTPQMQAHLQQAAIEEGDHLHWCEERLKELGEKTSRLNPFWYSASVLMGLLAGSFGDKFSLGFIAATESQVEQHLQSHLDQLPPEDHRTRAILLQMQVDEAHHGAQALAAGGEILPSWIQSVMQGIARVMTGSAYYL